MLQRIQQEGPLRATDFLQKRAKKGAVWWDWKPEKVALEQLFIEGELMVVERRGFQKVYDLTERMLPTGTETTMSSANKKTVRIFQSATFIGNGICRAYGYQDRS